MQEYNTCNTFRMRFKGGGGGGATQDASLCIAKSTEAFSRCKIRFVPRSTQIFVCVSRVLFDYNYSSFIVSF